YLQISGELGPFETTLKSWALMAVGRADEATALIDAMPSGARNLPGVAMVRAEYAAIEENPEMASEYLMKAGHSTIDIERVRSLYPFLARHEQWHAIAATDMAKPYRNSGAALLSAHACLRVNDLDGLARTLQVALRQWRHDPRFMRSLFELAMRRPGSEWEDRFADSFMANYQGLEIDPLIAYITYCFQLTRPDLAWLGYTRLLELDSRHPEVFYAPAQFGGSWYRFRRRGIGVGGTDRSATIDLRPLASHTKHLWPFSRLWRQVPLRRELAQLQLGETRERYMAWTLDELQTREKNGTLSMRGELIYPGVLASEERFEEAHQRLELIRKAYPPMVSEVLMRHAELYDRQKQWQDAYEALHAYYDSTDIIELQAEMLMVNALLNLNLGIGALHVAQRAAQLFPGVGYTDLLEAAIWDIFGYKEDALHVLGEHEDDVFIYAAARLSAETGRQSEAERLYRVVGQQAPVKQIEAAQRLDPIPSEITITRRWPAPMTPEEMRAAAAMYTQRVSHAQSPFIQGLDRLTSQWHASLGAAADLETWKAVGRNVFEEAIALHRLGVLEARQKRYDEAQEAIRAALDRLPESPILRRILLALTEGDDETIAAARRACPTDPEIWLASLVGRYRAEGGGPWMQTEADAAIRREEFSSGVMIRAGDLFLRAGQVDAASSLARYGLSKGKGIVSAYMLGLRCALEARDLEWALLCARSGIRNTQNPGVFYRAMVEIKAYQETPDADLITAWNISRSISRASANGGNISGICIFRMAIRNAL
ncbi:MAG: hypothetical protein O3A51_11705, partial [Verrucomicrobia bacterium]|nr:hypothetical protein [Verrucomicrobiota bacterium]